MSRALVSTFDLFFSPQGQGTPYPTPNAIISFIIKVFNYLYLLASSTRQEFCLFHLCTPSTWHCVWHAEVGQQQVKQLKCRIFYFEVFGSGCLGPGVGFGVGSAGVCSPIADVCHGHLHCAMVSPLSLLCPKTLPQAHDQGQRGKHQMNLSSSPQMS